MNGKDVVKRVMKLRGIGSPVLAKKLGYSAPSGITERLRGVQDMRVDTLATILTALDCEIIVRSKLEGHEKWVIDGKSEQE